jgi:dinuclear metal center YbgI/SA1388 family protein
MAGLAPRDRRGDAVSVRLSDVIDVLEEAYPPHLAAEWDSVGLVCGDPADAVDAITIAVDATAEVVAEVPERGLLLAHHPLLLRGVDTVAASTAKGSLLHRLIRGGSALFTAHTNADAASPGVSDALAETLGLQVEGALAPARAASGLDTWVVYVPATSADALRQAFFDAGAGKIGDYSQCCWSVAGTGQFLPLTGASPTIGSVGSIELLAEERIEIVAPAALRGAVLAAMRAAHPYEEPAYGVYPVAPLPAAEGIGRICTVAKPEPLSAFVSRVEAALPATAWGIRAAGDPDAVVSQVAVCGGAGDSLLDVVADADVQAYVTADLRHHPADEHRRASDVALVDVAHWASEYPWCGQAAALLRNRFGESVPVRVSSVRTDPWNIKREA